MLSRNEPPIAVIANIAETFYEFLSREPDSITRADRMRYELYLGDRTLLWVDVRKLVVTSLPVDSLEYVQNSLGFRDTGLLYPSAPTNWLCSDIVREQGLFQELIRYAGADKTLTLIPYSTTPQFIELVHLLASKGGINVLLPETPSQKNLWVIRHLDTKSGFRSLVRSWLSDSVVTIPEGFICRTPEEAGDAAEWFLSRKRPCILKANIGVSGFGNMVIDNGDATSEPIAKSIRSNPLFGSDLIVVEEFISSRNSLSPSFEGFVPSEHTRAVEMTYMSKQLFNDRGEFCGVAIDQEFEKESWYAPLVKAGLNVGKRLQELGYVGHFDMDAVVSDEGRIYLLEINPRRTGGTHVHEFARNVYGQDYIKRVSLLSNNSFSAGSCTTFEEVKHRLGNLLYSGGHQRSGVVPAVVSSVNQGSFGYIIVGRTGSEVMSVQREMLKLFEK
jgi:hypothetical protein